MEKSDLKLNSIVELTDYYDRKTVGTVIEFRENFEGKFAVVRVGWNSELQVPLQPCSSSQTQITGIYEQRKWIQKIY